MCRLLGFAAASQTTFADLIGEQQVSAFQRMARLHRDGWGTSWLDGAGSPAEGAARIGTHRASSGGLDDRGLGEALRSVESRARIAHLRLATDGMAVAEDNTHPFRRGDLSFAHNGSIAPAAGLEELLSPDIRASLTGETDSERYFGVIRTYLERGYPLVDAVHSGVSDVRARFPEASLNALLLSPTTLIVIHANRGVVPPADVLLGHGFVADDWPAGHVESYYEMSWRRLPGGGVAFTSSGAEQALATIEGSGGWEPLPHESVTAVDLATLEVEARLLDEVGVEALVAS